MSQALVSFPKVTLPSGQEVAYKNGLTYLNFCEKNPSLSIASEDTVIVYNEAKALVARNILSNVMSNVKSNKAWAKQAKETVTFKNGTFHKRATITFENGEASNTDMNDVELVREYVDRKKDAYTKSALQAKEFIKSNVPFQNGKMNSNDLTPAPLEA